MRILLHLLLPLIILGAGIGAFIFLNVPDENSAKTRGQSATNSGKNRPKPALVSTTVLPLVIKNVTVELISQGEIRAHQATILTPEINGKVIAISEQFEDGAYFAKGDTLLEIDPADYDSELVAAEAQLARTQAALILEQAKANQALLNWKDAGFDEAPSDLVLRKPQLKEAQANVRSAQSNLERAERNLLRTKVLAPYDGRVKNRLVGLGQQVGGTTALGEIFSTDSAEIRLPLTTRDLRFYNPPNQFSEKPSTTVKFTPLSGSADSPQWTGSILRAEGELDADSKQLFVIARINDPFGIESATSDAPSLYIGQSLRATISGETLENVYEIPRENLTDIDEVIVIRDGLLRHVGISPIWSNSEKVVTRTGIEPGDLLSTTSLPYAPEGYPVQIITEDEILASEKLTSALKSKPSDSRSRRDSSRGH
ncbi:MAG: efflux RND transporter periplasmic adaptor subunit [Akkermansiaceae bacterium]